VGGLCAAPIVFQTDLFGSHPAHEGGEKGGDLALLSRRCCFSPFTMRLIAYQFPSWSMVEFP